MSRNYSILRHIPTISFAVPAAVLVFAVATDNPEAVPVDCDRYPNAAVSHTFDSLANDADFMIGDARRGAEGATTRDTYQIKSHGLGEFAVLAGGIAGPVVTYSEVVGHSWGTISTESTGSFLTLSAGKTKDPAVNAPVTATFHCRKVVPAKPPRGSPRKR